MANERIEHGALDKTHMTEEAFRMMAHGMTKEEVLNRQADGHGGAGQSFLCTPSGMSETNPLSRKGKKVMSSMKHQYGSEKGKKVFYASRNKGTISGVD